MLTPDRVADNVRRTLSSITFPNDAPIVVALSGGGDSTALLHFAHGFFSGRGETDRLHAVTVDHGLRPESDEEARRAGRQCATLGIRHTIQCWRGAKPSTGLQAAARAARYRLLAEIAGDGIVLTGHTLDDQLETVAMRMARGSGRGLSGIAPATLYERRTWFVRPLIAQRRDALRGYLEGIGQDWIDDPSNTDPRFERVRVRGRLAEAQTDDRDIRAAFAARSQEAADAAALLRDEASWHFDAAARVAELAVPAAEEKGFALALALAMSWAGQRPNLATGDVLGKAIAFCLTAVPGKRMTASGCLLAKAGGRVRIVREKRNRRETGYGCDHLLASPDFAAAQALAERCGATFYPIPPISGYPD